MADLALQGPIAVTGASGYIAGHIIEILLNKGFHVRGSVRSLAADKLKFLRQLAGSERLTLLEVDLESGDFAPLLNGATAVIHTATAFIHTAEDPQRDIVNPAVDGTLRILRTCAASPSIRKVIITSSGGAIYRAGQIPDGYVYTEKDWNTVSTLENLPYFYAKRLAEQAAWNFVKENDQKQDVNHFELAVINPGFVLGPSKTLPINLSVYMLRRLLMGESATVPPGRFGLVDVRDVALAHVLTLERPESAGHRVFTFGTVASWRELVEHTRVQFPEYPVTPDNNPPPGPSFSMDTSLLQSFGLTPRADVAAIVRDTVENLIELGAVPDLRKK